MTYCIHCRRIVRRGPWALGGDWIHAHSGTKACDDDRAVAEPDHPLEDDDGLEDDW